MKLTNCFHKQNIVKARHFVELYLMAVDVEESSFVEYTQMWIKQTGLFKVYNAIFSFFKAFEVQMYLPLYNTLI